MNCKLLGIRQGCGLHIWVLPPNFWTDFLRSLYIGEILYFLILCFAKYSILAFYLRIFTAKIRHPVYVLTGIITAWGVAVVSLSPSISRSILAGIDSEMATQILVAILQCNPVSTFWEKNTPVNCPISNYAFFVSNAVPNIITDVAMLSLPLPCKLIYKFRALVNLGHLVLTSRYPSVILRLHRTKSQKIALAGVFMLGGL